jgi:tetratricopeptide (TPR) repeat protein
MSSLDLRSAASLLERGDYDTARSTLEELVRIDRNHAAAHALLAKIAEAQARYSAAVLHWEQAYAINPMSTEIGLSFQAAALRLLSPNPASGTERHLRSVPPIETIQPEGVETHEEDEILEEITARADDLSKLIDELDAVRMVPDPDIELISDDELEVEIEDVVSETLAKIYASQNYFQEAGDVYRKLAIQYPERESEFMAKADDMNDRAVARN